MLTLPKSKKRTVRVLSTISCTWRIAPEVLWERIIREAMIRTVISLILILLEIQRMTTLALWGMIIKLTGYGGLLDEVQAKLVSNQTLSRTSWDTVKNHKIHCSPSESLAVTFSQISVEAERGSWLCLNQWTEKHFQDIKYRSVPLNILTPLGREIFACNSHRALISTEKKPSPQISIF